MRFNLKLPESVESQILDIKTETSDLEPLTEVERYIKCANVIDDDDPIVPCIKQISDLVPNNPDLIKMSQYSHTRFVATMVLLARLHRDGCSEHKVKTKHGVCKVCIKSRFPSVSQLSNDSENVRLLNKFVKAAKRTPDELIKICPDLKATLCDN